MYVLIKGGHLSGDAVIDVFFDGTSFEVFTLPRILQKKAHGSGCTLSAVSTGLIACGEKPVDAVRKAKAIVWGMIAQGYSPGKGADVLDQESDIVVPDWFPSDEGFLVWWDLHRVFDRLIDLVPVSFIPEVGINIAYAIPGARSVDEVCALSGRLLRRGEQVMRCGNLVFGGSKHVASIVLTTMSFDPKIRCAMNVRYSKSRVAVCQDLNMQIGDFDRCDEPFHIESTMEWGTQQVIQELGGVPDIIYDRGGVGKEPMIRILGKNPKDVLSKLEEIVKESS
jgi:hydroxymethylpyrimidine/phosphomethylpyrimidine kinase